MDNNVDVGVPPQNQNKCPCPCMSLQTGTKVIALIEIVVEVICLMLLFYLFIVHLSKDLSDGLGYFMFLGGILLLNSTVSIFLYIGAAKGNANHILIWIVVSGIYIGFAVVSAITKRSIGAFFSLVFRIYFMWVVCSFRNGLKEKQNSAGPSVSPA